MAQKSLSTIFSVCVLLLFSKMGASLATRRQDSTIKCTDFVFDLQILASNDFGLALPAATYNISATYCPPLKKVVHRAQSVQLLVHGATGNKLYWSALAPEGQSAQYHPSNYSWTEFSRRQGYHTLAIDRLGCGNSSHPDPKLVRATPELQTVSQIIGVLHSKSRKTSMSFLPSFSTIVCNGFSYGSLVLDILLNNPPSPPIISLINATILTGYSHIPNLNGNVNVSGAIQQFGPASKIFPKRFQGLDPGYRTIANAPNYAQSFFEGNYDPELPKIIWSREDVQASGEVASLGAGASSFNISSVPSYRAPTAIVAGQFDGPLCEGDCGE